MYISLHIVALIRYKNKNLSDFIRVDAWNLM